MVRHPVRRKELGFLEVEGRRDDRSALSDRKRRGLIWKREQA